MPEVLKDKKNNSELAERGYVVVDFLSQQKIKSLFDFYFSNPNSFPSPFHATHFNTDVSYKQKVQQFILETVRENLSLQFSYHYPVFANFMVKEGGGNNPMPLHADWTYVDESISSSYAVWIPLVDTNFENGCIGVIPFSHQLSYHIRGPMILQWTHPNEEILISQLGNLLPLQTGQALIYNHRTLHYSLPNNSKSIRPSINISLVLKGERMIHYTMPEGQNEVLKFEVDGESFFLDYDNFQMPRHGKVVEKLPIESIPLMNDKVGAFVQRHQPKGLRSYLKKIFA